MQIVVETAQLTGFVATELWCVHTAEALEHLEHRRSVYDSAAADDDLPIERQALQLGCLLVVVCAMGQS